MFQMYAAGAVFLTIALAAALFGFGIVSDDESLAAKLCAGFFFLAALAAFGWAWMNRSRAVAEPARRRPTGIRRPSAGDGIRRQGLEWEVP